MSAAPPAAHQADAQRRQNASSDSSRAPAVAASSSMRVDPATSAVPAAAAAAAAMVAPSAGQAAKPAMPPSEPRRSAVSTSSSAASKPASAAPASHAARSAVVRSNAKPLLSKLPPSSASSSAKPPAGTLTRAADMPGINFGRHTLGSIAAVLQGTFGHAAMKDTQAAAVGAILRGEDCFVLAPTGGGKSLCFQLPAVLLSQECPGSVVLVVSPLIALMRDQVIALRAKGVHAAMLGSAVSEEEKREVMRDLRTHPHSQPSQQKKEDDSRPVEDTEREEEWEAWRAANGVPSAASSSASAKAAAAAAEGKQQWSGPRYSIVYVSPEFLSGSVGRDLVSGLVRAGRCPFIAIDEVHCLSSWGHDFRRSYLALSSLRREHPGVPLMLLTATATRQVQGDVLRVLGLPKETVTFVRQSFNRPNISYAVQMKEVIKMEGDMSSTGGGEDGEDGGGSSEGMNIYKHMARFITQCIGGGGDAGKAGSSAAAKVSPAVAGARALFGSASSAATAPPATPATPTSSAAAAPPASSSSSSVRGSGIIYVSRREECHSVAGKLRELHVTASAYHAGLSAQERTRTQADWMENKISCVVCTSAFAMGIDMASVRFVIHFQVPNSLESLYQESGRAGRDGLPAKSLVYYSQADVRTAEYFARLENNKDDDGSSSSSGASARAGAGAKAASAKGGFPRTGTPEHRLDLLQSVVSFCESTSSCRRALILRYFDEAVPDPEEKIALARKEKRCCDVCADPARVEQNLMMAKSLGSRGSAGASLAPVRGAKYSGGKSGGGDDEYEYDESELYSSQREKKRREEDDDDARVSVPKHILMDKSSGGLHRMIDHLAAAERASERAAGTERKHVSVPFASLGKGGGGIAGTKRPRPGLYNGPLLGVDGNHVIRDLPTSKRELCLDKLRSLVDANFALPSAPGAAGPPLAAHSAVDCASALEFGCFSLHATPSSYQGALRSLMQEIAQATKAGKRFGGIERIDWATLPRKQSSDSEEHSESDSGGSDGEDDEEDEDGPPAPKRSRLAEAIAAAPAGGFVSASSLTKGKSAAGGLARGAVSGLNSASASEGGFKSARSALAGPVAGASKGKPPASSSSSSLAASFTPASKLGASSGPARPASSFTASSSKAGSSQAALLTPPKLKFGTRLSVSWVHPPPSSSSAAPAPGVSPSRIAPLSLSRVPQSPARSTSPTSTTNKRMKLDLTLSPEKPRTHAAAPTTTTVEPLAAPAPNLAASANATRAAIDLSSSP